MDAGGRATQEQLPKVLLRAQQDVQLSVEHVATRSFAYMEVGKGREQERKLYPTYRKHPRSTVY